MALEAKGKPEGEENPKEKKKEKPEEKKAKKGEEGTKSKTVMFTVFCTVKYKLDVLHICV